MVGKKLKTGYMYQSYRMQTVECTVTAQLWPICSNFLLMNIVIVDFANVCIRKRRKKGERNMLVTHCVVMGTCYTTSLLKEISLLLINKTDFPHVDSIYNECVRQRRKRGRERETHGSFQITETRINKSILLYVTHSINWRQHKNKFLLRLGKKWWPNCCWVWQPLFAFGVTWPMRKSAMNIVKKV